MDLFILIHLFFTLTLLSIPFWSIKYLEYGVYIPLILSIIWIFCDGCPFTKFHKTNSSSFSQDVLQFFIPNASEKLNEHVTLFIVLSITIIGFKRLNNIENTNKIEIN